MYEERGMPRIEGDPEPRFLDDDNPTDAEMLAWIRWRDRHEVEIEPWKICQPDYDEEDLKMLVRFES
jgi:hypothetical protein